MTTLRQDLNAGMLVAVILIPQAMAYARLAGFEPKYGLYASIVPLITYALLGTSRQLSIGPVAITSILILSGLGAVIEPFTAEYMYWSIAIGICAGIIQLLMGVFRLGFITHFLSYPVILGFTTAAAFIIAITQLADATGLDLSYVNHRLMKVVVVAQQVHAINPYTLAVFIGSVTFILLAKKISKHIPSALILVFGLTIATYYFFQYHNVAYVGNIPTGLPRLELPRVSFSSLADQCVTILSLAIIGIVENLSIARTLESKHKSYKIDTNQELIAIGASKIVGGMFQSMPTSGSFSRSAINDEAGAHTSVSTLFTSLIIVVTLLFITDYFYFLPKALLAGIIIVSIKGLIKPSEIKELYRISKADFIMMIVTFITTIAAGITYGVLFGVILSLLAVLYRSSRPEVNILGNLPATNSYRNMLRYPDAEPVHDVLIVRFDDQLYFGNCNHFSNTVERHVESCDRTVHHLILDAGNIHHVDSSGIRVIADMNIWLQRRDIQMHIARAIGPVRDMLNKSNLMDNKEHYMNVHAAIRSVTQKSTNQ